MNHCDIERTALAPRADDVTLATTPIDKTMVAKGLIGVIISSVALVIALFSSSAQPPPPALCPPPQQLVQGTCK